MNLTGLINQLGVRYPLRMHSNIQYINKNTSMPTKGISPLVCDE